jgi:thiamine biosynthesis protein ThiS
LRGILRIHVNGESRELSARLSLQQLMTDLSLPHERVAIELNHEVISRAAWATTDLKDGDRIEIVHFVGGGSDRQESDGDRRQEAGSQGRPASDDQQGSRRHAIA